jgi:hypothetical protein
MKRLRDRCISTFQIAIFLAAVASVLTADAWPCTYLTVSGGEPERVLGCLPLEKGVLFHLEFMNSIYLAPVRETFVYEPSEGICLVKVESPSAGVFEYYRLIPDGPGTALLHRPVGEFRLRSHDYEHHRLTVGEKSLRLKGLVPDGEPLVVRVRTTDDGCAAGGSRGRGD